MVKPKLTDAAFARFTDRLSHYCNERPSGWISRFVMGDITTAWNMTLTDPADIRGWRRVDGVATSGNRPATYTHAVIFQTDHEAMVAALNEDPLSRRVAAAYCIGDNVMAGTVKDVGRPIRQEGLEQSDLLQIGLRVGRGAMDATLGVYDEETNRFHNLATDVDLLCEPEPIAEVQRRFPGAILL